MLIVANLSYVTTSSPYPLTKRKCWLLNNRTTKFSPSSTSQIQGVGRSTRRTLSAVKPFLTSTPSSLHKSPYFSGQTIMENGCLIRLTTQSFTLSYCWNNVTAKCILIIIWYIIHWINPHCGLIMLAIV